ncbi:hypothetical protein CHCC14821_2139 [Bacillus paralicheniformis]|nr:hypothetical protein CHCC14821_2139 [Bacillus paralicheniformis]
MPCRIRIPRDDIKQVGELPIIQSGVCSHKIRRHGQVGVKRTDMGNFMPAKINRLIRDKTLPVQIQTVNSILAVRSRRLDLVPICIGVAPKRCPPCMIKAVQRFIFREQPLSELILAKFTMTLSAVFIGDMPADDSRVMRIALRKPSVYNRSFPAVDRRRIAMIVPLSVKVSDPVALRSQHLGILFGHPSRSGTARCSQERINSVFLESIKNLIEPIKCKPSFFRLERNP